MAIATSKECCIQPLSPNPLNKEGPFLPRLERRGLPGPISVMNFPSVSTQTAVDAQPQGETDTRLRGRWLVLARVVWVGSAVLSLGLVIASIPSYFAFLHVLCTGAPATCRNNGQVTPDYLRALQALGLSLDFFATYLVALVIVFALVYASIAAVIF